MQDRTKRSIEGEWVSSTGTGTIAKAARPSWSATPVEDRAKFGA